MDGDRRPERPGECESALTWFVLPATTVGAFAATIVSLLKTNRVWATVGMVAAVSSLWLMIWSWTATSDSLADLGIAALYLVWAGPLTLIALAGTLRSPRAGSPWQRRQQLQ